MNEDDMKSSPDFDLDEETLFIVSQTFKALSDPTCLRILNLLFEENILLMKLLISYHYCNQLYHTSFVS